MNNLMYQKFIIGDFVVNIDNKEDLQFIGSIERIDGEDIINTISLIPGVRSEEGPDYRYRAIFEENLNQYKLVDRIFKGTSDWFCKHKCAFNINCNECPIKPSEENFFFIGDEAYISGQSDGYFVNSIAFYKDFAAEKIAWYLDTLSKEEDSNNIINHIKEEVKDCKIYYGIKYKYYDKFDGSFGKNLKLQKRVGFTVDSEGYCPLCKENNCDNCIIKR